MKSTVQILARVVTHTAQIFVALVCLSPDTTVTADDLASKPASVPAEYLSMIKRGVTGLRDVFAKLNSWEFSGSVWVETADAFMQLHAPADSLDRDQKKSGQYRIRELRSGNLWMAQRERIRADGSTLSSETFYTTPESMIHKMVGKSANATIYPYRGEKRTTVADYFDSVMLIYSFLSPDWGEGRIPHLDPSILNSADAWNKALDFAGSAELTPDGAIRLVFVKVRSKVVVDFALSPDGMQRWPVRLKTLTKDDRLICEFEVISFSKEPQALGLPNAFRLKTYSATQGATESLPVATWEYKFDTLKTNIAIDEDALAFDPVNVDEIRDEATKTNILVPK